MDKQLEINVATSLEALKGYYGQLLSELNRTETLNVKRVTAFQKRAFGEGIQKILANCARAIENLGKGNLRAVADALDYIQARRGPLFPRIVPGIASECGPIMVYDPSRSGSFRTGITGRLLKSLALRIRGEMFRGSMRVYDDDNV